MEKQKLSTINNVCLVILACIGVTFSLVYTKAVLVPFVISFFIFAVISPLFECFRTKYKINSLLSLLITATILFVIVGLIIFFLVVSFEDFFKSAELYKSKILQFINWGSSQAESFGYKIDDALLKEEIKNLPILKWVKGLTGGIVNILGNSFLIFILTLFMLLGEKKTSMENPMVREIHLKISRYIATKLSTSIATGVLVGLLFFICGVDLALMFMVLTILLNFIPSFGSIIATILPIPVILLQYGLGWQFAVVVIGCAVVQVIIGNVIEPKMMGESMDLHPIAIMVFLLFWGLVWGVPGMFLAVPITAIMKITFARIETTKAFSELLAGRI